MTIGQVIVGVRDLDAATVRFERMGLCVVDGGVHPGLGTANRVIPLATSYLELLGVIDRAQAAATPYGRSLLERTEHGDRLVRWSIRTDRITEVCARLGLSPERRRRIRPDGSVLTWQAAGLELALREPWLPFFMQWDEPGDFPGAIPVRHPIGECRLSRLEVSPSDSARFARWTAQNRDLPVCVAGRGGGIDAVAIATPGGELVVDNRSCDGD